jgi:hypothetical protein
VKRIDHQTVELTADEIGARDWFEDMLDRGAGIHDALDRMRAVLADPNFAAWLIGNEHDPRPADLRYVELGWRDPDGKVTFTCFIVSTKTPDAAVVEAKRILADQRPDATDVDEFLQRRLSPRSAERIQHAMAVGTWQGWLEHGRER